MTDGRHVPRLQNPPPARHYAIRGGAPLTPRSLPSWAPRPPVPGGGVHEAAQRIPAVTRVLTRRVRGHRGHRGHRNEGRTGEGKGRGAEAGGRRQGGGPRADPQASHGTASSDAPANSQATGRRVSRAAIAPLTATLRHFPHADSLSSPHRRTLGLAAPGRPAQRLRCKAAGPAPPAGGSQARSRRWALRHTRAQQ